MTSEKAKQVREEIFAFLCQYDEENGYGPSLREINKACYVSTSTVLRHLDALEFEGRIRRDPNRARAIYIIRKATKTE